MADYVPPKVFEDLPDDWQLGDTVPDASQVRAADLLAIGQSAADYADEQIAALPPSSGTGITIADANGLFPSRELLAFVGAGVSVTDNEDGNAIVVTVPGGGGDGSGATGLLAPAEFQGRTTGPAGGKNIWPNRQISADGYTRTATSAIYWVRKPIYEEVRDPFVVVANSTTNGTNESTTGLAAITVRSALMVNGVVTQLGYDGATTAKTVQAGAVAVSDKAVGLLLKPTDEVFEICVVTGQAAGQWPANNDLQPNATDGSGWLVGPSGGQITAALTTGAGAQTTLGAGSGNPYAFTSSALCGTYTGGRKRSAAIFGDSIASTVDSGSNGDKAFVVRALELAKVPYVRLSNSGDQLNNIATSTVRLALAKYCSDAFVQAGVNDILAQRTLSVLQASLLAAANAIRGQGLQRVHVGTITPTTQGGAGAQTQIPGTGARIPYNDFLRARAPVVDGEPVAAGTEGALLAGDGAHPVSDVFDVADIAETSRNSGIFKTGIYADGVHESAVGVLAYGRAIPVLGYRPAEPRKTLKVLPGSVYAPQFAAAATPEAGDGIGGFFSGAFMRLDDAVTIDQLQAVNAGSGTAGLLAYMFVHRQNDDTGDFELVASTASFDGSSNGGQNVDLPSPARIAPGLLALSYGLAGSPASRPLLRGGSGSAVPLAGLPTTTTSGYRGPMSSGTPPTVLPIAGIIAAAPAIAMRVSRV